MNNKVYEADIRVTGLITSDGLKLTREQWDEKFIMLFQNINKKYDQFELLHFIYFIKNSMLSFYVRFEFEPNKKWDMTDSSDSTRYFFNELLGTSGGIGDFISYTHGSSKICKD